MKKRIVFTVTTDLNSDQRMIRICNSLQKAGYEIVLIGRKRKSSLPLVKQIFKQRRMNLFFEKGKLFYAEYNIRLCFVLLFVQCDAICSIDLDTIVPGIINAKLRGKKHFYDAHEWFPELPEVVSRPAIKKLWQWVEQFAFRNTSAAYTVSNSIAEQFELRYHQKVDVIRNVPVKYDISTSGKKKYEVVYQGNLNVGRGLREFILSMPELPSIQLNIVGDGEMKTELVKLTTELKLNNRVKFLGHMPPEELKLFTQTQWLGINLMENLGLSYWYSLPNKYFDYIMAGIPQLAVKFPEFEKLNNEIETALLIDDLQKITIVDAMKKLLNDELFYQELEHNNVKAKEIYCWQKEEKILLDFYNSNL